MSSVTRIHNEAFQDEQQKAMEKLNERWTSFSKVTKVADKLFQKASTLKDVSNMLKDAIEKISSILQRLTHPAAIIDWPCKSMWQIMMVHMHLCISQHVCIHNCK